MSFFDRFYDVQWWVAIRPHSDRFDAPLDFRVLKNTWRYWCADPFVFDHEGKTYLFMEVADKTTLRGSIGYRVIENGKVSKIHICLDTGYHMSYPMVYAQDGEIYMIPECFASKTLTVYRAVEFPDKWEPCEMVFQDKMLCDTNFLEHDGREYLLTMPLSGPVFCYDRLELYHRLPGGDWQRSPASPLILGADRARNGGHFFRLGTDLIRPSQNCGNSYGEELRLNRVTKLGPDGMEEALYKTVTVADIRTDRGTFDGIHTFNRSQSWDVIDLRVQRSFQGARALYFIRSKLRRKP